MGLLVLSTQLCCKPKTAKNGGEGMGRAVNLKKEMI